MAASAIFTDDLFLEHDTGGGHPETSRRLVSIREKLEGASYFGEFRPLDRYFATVDEIALVHDPDYVRSVDEFCKPGGGFLDGDTIVSRRSYEAATLAAGAGIEAARRVNAGDVSRALLLLRPPGHHSLHGRAMGFCLFNNVAICARALQGMGHKRVAIVDWDVHHGNGTEATFYDDPNTLFISLHQYPYYPGTGAAKDTGSGAGAGFTLNLPMASGARDEDYKRAFETGVLPRLKEFKPAVLLISAGFDAHHMDPLAGIELSTGCYEWMTRELRGFADEFCEGRLISFLEGGYNLSALAESVETHAAALL